MQNLSKISNRSTILEEDMILFIKSLQKTNESKKIISIESQEYVDGMVDYYGADVDYELSEKRVIGVDGAKWNERLRKQKRNDSDVYRVGILWSTGLDSTVLKEKLTEQRKELRITKLIGLSSS